MGHRQVLAATKCRDFGAVQQIARPEVTGRKGAQGATALLDYRVGGYR